MALKLIEHTCSCNFKVVGYDSFEKGYLNQPFLQPHGQSDLSGLSVQLYLFSI
jgi:hypothetical protein